MFTYHNKVVLVTGATGSLGGELCIEFVRRGAKIAMCARSQDRLEALATGIGHLGGECIYKAVDISVADQIREFVGIVVSKYKYVDVLVNNAGIVYYSNFQNITNETVENEIRVNYLGPVYFMKGIMPIMLTRGRGQVINISSILAYRPFPLLASYSASKAALSAFTDSLRIEMHGERIDIINVYLGKVKGGISEGEQLIAGGKNRKIMKNGMKPRQAARKIIDAASRGKEIIHSPRSGRYIMWLNSVFPYVFENILYRAKVK